MYYYHYCFYVLALVKLYITYVVPISTLIMNSIQSEDNEVCTLVTR